MITMMFQTEKIKHLLDLIETEEHALEKKHYFDPEKSIVNTCSINVIPTEN